MARRARSASSSASRRRSRTRLPGGFPGPWPRGLPPLWRWRSVRWLAVAVGLVGAVLGLRESEILQPVAMPYSRELYPHWLDLDGDCRDTRQEVLAAQSARPVRWSADGCKVESGRWRDPYSGETFTDPRRLDVDHVVPLAEAHRSGADRWTEEQRARFANDPENLLAVDSSENRSKADGDPLSWMPPNLAAWCWYVGRFVTVKRHYGLRQDPLERAWTGALLWVCGEGG